MQKIYTAIEFSEEICKIVQIGVDKDIASLHKAITINLCLDGENLKDLSAQVQAQRITDGLKSNSIKPKETVLIIPKNFVKIRVSQLPSIDDEELSQMARFEAERHILFQADQHVIDYYVMEKNEIGGSKVLIASVDSTLINPFLEILSLAKIEVQTTTVSSLCLFNDLKFLRPDQINDGPFAITNIGYTHTDITIVNKGTITFARSLTIGISQLTESLQIKSSEDKLTKALLSGIYFDAKEEKENIELPSEQVFVIDEDNLKIDSPDVYDDTLKTETLENISIVVSQNIIEEDSDVIDANTDDPLIATPEEAAPVQIQIINDIAEVPIEKTESIDVPAIAKEWLGKLTNEITRTYEFACREYECSPMKSIILIGAGTYIKDIVKKFEESFHIPVEIIDPMGSLQCPKELEDVKYNSGANYAIVVGGILPYINNDLIQVNIMPKEYLGNMRKKRRNRSLSISGSLLLITIILLTVWLQQISVLKTNLLNFYDEQNKKAKPIVDEITDKKTKLKIIEDYVEDKYSPLVILNEISKYSDLIPSKVSIINFEYKKNQIVSIDGWAITIAELNKFENKLRSSGIFEEVQVIDRTNEDFKNRGNFINFKIDCLFNKEVKTKKNAE